MPYHNLRVNPSVANQQQQINVSVEVENTGRRRGDEVVQLYVKDKVSSVTTYESDLRGFERITLNPGETKSVNFTLRPDDLALLDKNMNWTVEPGAFEIRIGTSSEDIKLSRELVIQ